MDKGSARNSERFEHPHALRIQSGAKPNFIFAIRKRLPDWTIEEYFSSIAQPPAS